MMIPSQAIIIANYLTIADWGIRNTYAALILPNAAAAFAVFNMRQAFLTLPKEIHEAAEIDGCTNFKFLYTIGVPLIKPSLGALIIYVFLQSWNYYLWPLLVTDSVNMRTVQIGLGMLQGAEATDFRPVIIKGGFLYEQQKMDGDSFRRNHGCISGSSVLSKCS